MEGFVSVVFYIHWRSPKSVHKFSLYVTSKKAFRGVNCYKSFLRKTITDVKTRPVVESGSPRRSDLTRTEPPLSNPQTAVTPYEHHERGSRQNETPSLETEVLVNFFPPGNRGDFIFF